MIKISNVETYPHCYLVRNRNPALISLLIDAQTFNHCHCLIDLNVKGVESDFTGRVDDHRPGRAPRTIASHNLWDFMRLRVAGGVSHGNLKAVLQLVLTQLRLGIEIKSFEHRLHG